MLRLRTTLLVMVIGVAPFGTGVAAPATCDDFLAITHKKPTQLDFVGCKQRFDLQGKPWQATYRVRGVHAGEVERYLMKVFKVKKLTRTCCVWESINNSYRDAEFRPLVISIATEETRVTSRARWREIPYFYVTVSVYPEAP